MGILIDADTRVCIQGITGRIGRVQAGHMLREGTRIVSGVTPGKGGQEVEGVPVFDTVARAQTACRADASVVFVPPPAAEAACVEAIEAGVELVVLVTEGVPVHSTMRIRARAEAAGARLIGPTTPGVISPGCQKLGIMPARLFSPGPVGVISRSGTLSYEVAGALSRAGLGQSTVVGIGADPVVGTDIQDLLALFEEDPRTEAVVIVGEVGGSQEERAAAFISARAGKPVVAYVAGRTSPEGVRMGHAGAIVSGGAGSVTSKEEALAAAGVRVARRPADVVRLVREALCETRMPAVPQGRRAVVRIEHALCKGTEGCSICVHVCPEDVLGSSPGLSARGVHPAAVMHPGKCTGCDLCMLHCPDLAVAVDHPKEHAHA